MNSVTSARIRLSVPSPGTLRSSSPWPLITDLFGRRVTRGSGGQHCVPFCPLTHARHGWTCCRPAGPAANPSSWVTAQRGRCPDTAEQRRHRAVPRHAHVIDAVSAGGHPATKHGTFRRRSRRNRRPPAFHQSMRASSTAAGDIAGLRGERGHATGRAHRGSLLSGTPSPGRGASPCNGCD